MPKPNLTAIALRNEREMLRTFNAIVADIKYNVTLNELVRALEVGNVDGAIKLLGLDESTWEPLSDSIRSSYREGGITGAVQIGNIPNEAGTLVMRFNVRNPRAEQWVSQQSSRLITEIIEDQRNMVRQVLTNNLALGNNPRTAALDMVGRIDPITKKRTGGMIGLTSKQAEWSANARIELEQLNPNYFTRQLRDQRLDSRIRKAMESGEVLDAKTIDSAITRMQQRTLRYRGEVIARTESINALRAGHHESIAQAIEVGELDQRDVMKEWDSSGDDGRTREAHAQAGIDYAGGIPFDQPFIVGGEALMYPGDPSGSAAMTIQCRCREKTVINFAGKVKRLEGFR
jgi:hypothetical protein